MPRARRKAAQAKSGGVVKDFVKRKERLGKKSVRENATNTKIKSRQIYMPGGPDEDDVINSALKRGLTYQQLVVRATHYNSGTRISALNGLSKAILDGSLAASTHARLDGINLVRVSLNALQDDEVGVRNASINLLTSLIKHLKSVKPVAALLSATLMACLSHIRKDVQIVAAQAITSVFDGIDPGDNSTFILPVHIFGSKLGDVLIGLANLLPMAKIPKKKAVIINAITAVLRSPASGNHKTKSNTNKKVASAGDAVAAPFFYHSLDDDIDDEGALEGDTTFSSEEMKPALNSVTKRVANIVLECLPIHETKKDKPLVSVLLASVRCLHTALNACARGDETCNSEIDQANLKLVHRILKNWAKERNRHHERGTLHTVHNYIAGCALAVAEWEICGAYLTNVLNYSVTPVPTGTEQLNNGDKKNISVERVTEMFLKTPHQCTNADVDIEEEKEKVRDVWIIRWMHALEMGNIYYIASSVSVSILKKIVAKPMEEDDTSWEVVLKLPAVVAMAAAMDMETEEDGMKELVDCTLKALANQCRSKHRRIQDELVPQIEAHFVDEKLLRNMSGDIMVEFMAVLFYSGEFSSMKMLQIVVNMTNVDLNEQGMQFATALFNIIDAHFEEYQRQCSNILDLYAALSIVAEASQNYEDNIPLANECTQVVNRIMAHIDGGDA